jgi:carbon-monoxide dehydrogenase large subunit
MSDSNLTRDARSIPRLQSRRLMAGGGRFAANLPAEGLHAAFVRSPFAFATVVSIDTEPALALEGVHGVFTHRDLREMGAGTFPVAWVVPGQRATEIMLLSDEVVRHAGDPIAVVVADSARVAEDAAELVLVEYDALPAVPDVDHGLAPGAPLVHPEWGDNVMARHTVAAGDVDAAFERAALVVSDRFRIGRSSAMPLEPRAATARYDPLEDEVVLESSTQSPHHVRADLAACLGRPERSIRVIATDVGGSFGAKDHASGAEGILCVLAIRFGVPVRWVEQRTEHVATSGHSREQIYDVELAVDADGRILGLRGRLLFDAGAYASTHGMGTAIYSTSVLPNVYRFKDYRIEAIAVATNKAPSGAYRGYGAPEATFVMESLVDEVARRLGLDPAEVRRRNLMTPQEMTEPTAGGCLYDPIDVGRLLDVCLDASGYEDFRRAHPRDRARTSTVRDGVGIASVVLLGGFGPSRPALESGLHCGGHESAAIRMDADGNVVVFTGMPTIGQGIDTTLAQVAAARLGVDPSRDVRVIAGDTGRTPYSPWGPVSSRGAAVGGGAVNAASERLADSLRRAAAIELEVSPSDIELAEGRARVRGAPDVGRTIAEVAAAIRRGSFVTQGIEPSLETVAVFDPPELTYSFAIHVAFVRLDTSTGHVTVPRYVTASDCGRLLNPAIVRGQIEGGVVQGIGGAMFEEIVYGEDAELLTANLGDYGMPTAMEVPPIEVHLQETPTDRNPTGARGAGEIGIIGPAAAIGNAIADALGPDRAAPRQVPFTVERVWQLANRLVSAG